MSRATITSAVGGGLYNAEVNFNTEVIRFNVERFRLRQDDIEAVDFPAADAALADAEIALSDASANLNELIKQLEGKPSAALFAALNAAASALSSASALLTNTDTGLINAAAFIAQAAADLPPSPDPPSVAAINAAGVATGLASSSVSDEQNEVSTAQGQVSSLISFLSAPDPDLSSAQNQITAILDQLDTIITAHVQASSDINFAQGQTQAARNTLPGDTSYDTSRADLDNALAAFSSTTSSHTAANAQYVTAQSQIGQAQTLLQPGREEIRKQVVEATKALGEAGKARAVAKFTVDSLSLEFEELERKIGQLEDIPESESKQLWCADLTDDLTSGTVVGTIEVPGEYGGPQSGEAVIRPGFDHEHLWNQQRDGWITPCQAQTAAATYYNLAMLPGWQVFRPGFRFARVLAVNGDGTLKVALISPNLSSQQSIDVTPKDLPSSGPEQAVNYDSVPVHYMDCDAAAFALGDEVVVEYQNQQATRPRVIGFRRNPASCSGQLATPAGSITPSSGSYTFSANASLQYGAMDWRGTAGSFSWDGSEARYFNSPLFEGLSENIYRNGGVFVHAPGPVCGVGVTEAGLMTVVVVEDHHFGFDGINGATGEITTKFAFYQAPAGTEEWTRIGEYKLNDFASFEDVTELIATIRPPHWRFNSSGTQAVTNGIGWLAGSGFYGQGMPMEILVDFPGNVPAFTTIPSTEDLVDGNEIAAFYTHVFSDYRGDDLVWADFSIDGTDGDLSGAGTDRMYISIPVDSYTALIYTGHSTDVGNSDWDFVEFQSIDLRLTPPLFTQLRLIGEWHGSAASIFVTTTLEYLKVDASVETLDTYSSFPAGSPVGKDLVSGGIVTYIRFIYSGLYATLARLLSFSGMIGTTVNSGVPEEEIIDPIDHGGTQGTLKTGEALFSSGFFVKDFLRRPDGDYQALTGSAYHAHIGVK